VSDGALLEVAGLSKHYGGLAAVDDLTFAVRAGEAFGIAGPNGAGKTTLFDAITGHARATAGGIRFEGAEIQTRRSHEICQAGIARTFQVPAVFPEHTVLANVMIGSYFGQPGRRLPGVRFDADAVRRAREAVAFVGLDGRLDAPAGALPLFDKKRLMIASAIATSPRLLMLDEPVGGLNPGEVDAVLALIRKIRSSGVTIVMIEHVMRALMSISDRVLVMNHGRLLFEGTPEDVQQHEDVIRVYLGTEQGPDATSGVGGGDERHELEEWRAAEPRHIEADAEHELRGVEAERDDGAPRA
jgi:branched-chain amino acid transport system ATP-binding protein